MIRAIAAPKYPAPPGSGGTFFGSRALAGFSADFSATPSFTEAKEINPKTEKNIM